MRTRTLIPALMAALFVLVATATGALAHAGADTIELATDDDLLESMLRFAAMRRQRSRLKIPGRWPAHLRNPAAEPEERLP